MRRGRNASKREKEREHGCTTIDHDVLVHRRHEECEIGGQNPSTLNASRHGPCEHMKVTVSSLVEKEMGWQAKS